MHIYFSQFEGSSLIFDKENRLSIYKTGVPTPFTQTYDGDGLKRTEQSASGIVTLVWDGDDYLQERS